MTQPQAGRALGDDVAVPLSGAATTEPPSEADLPVGPDSTPDRSVPDETIGAGAAAAPTRTRAAIAWSYVLTLGRFTTTAVVTFVMAGFLQPRAYGVMALAMVWVVFAQSLSLHGPAQAVIQRGEVTPRHYDAAFWLTVGSAVVMAAIFSGLAPLWARVNDAPDLIVVCWALAPAIVLNALIVVPDAILQRNLHFKRLSLRVLIGGLISGALGIGVAVAGGGVWALVVQQLSQTAISAALVWFAVRWRPRRGPLKAPIRDLWQYSMHSFSGFFAQFIATRSDALLMGTFFGPVAIGLYRFAGRITSTVNDVAVGGLSQVSLPHLSRYAQDHKIFAARLGRVIHAGSLIALPAFGILIPCAKDVLAIIGPQWSDAGPALVILCLAGMLSSLGVITGAALQAAGRPGASAAIGWTVATITAITLILVGRRYAPEGPEHQVLAISIAYTSINFFACAVAMFVTFRVVLHQPIWPALRPSMPAAAASALAIAVGTAVRPLLHGANAFTSLVVIGGAASIVAGIVLLLWDTEVRSYAIRIRASLRPRTA